MMKSVVTLGDVVRKSEMIGNNGAMSVEAVNELKDSKKCIVVQPCVCSIFDLQQINKLVNISSCSVRGNENKHSSHAVDNETNGSIYPRDLLVSDKMTCTTCDVSFTTRKQQVQHYKMGWHQWNLTEKMKRNSPVSETEYNKLLVKLSELSELEADNAEENTCFAFFKANDEFSQTSTSDEEDIASLNLQPKISFEIDDGKSVEIYRCVVYPKKVSPPCEENLSTVLKKIYEESVWAIILIGGGYFSAAVYEMNDIIQHKTFHRYTVRSKQGCSQGTRDGKRSGHKAKTAGSVLRRHNEAALAKEIQELLMSWAPELSLCHRIFYRALIHNKKILFGGKNPPFNRKDDRLRTIPFPTRRANFREIQRIHKILSTLECFDRGKSDMQKMCNKNSKKPADKSSFLPNEGACSQVVTTPFLKSRTIPTICCNSQSCNVEKNSKYELNVLEKMNPSDKNAQKDSIDGNIEQLNVNSNRLQINICTFSESDFKSTDSAFEYNDPKMKSQNHYTVPNTSCLLFSGEGDTKRENNLSIFGLKESKKQIMRKKKVSTANVKVKDTRKILKEVALQDDRDTKSLPKKTQTSLLEKDAKATNSIEDSSEKNVRNSSVPNEANTDTFPDTDAAQILLVVSATNKISIKDTERQKEKKKAKKAKLKEKNILAAQLKAEEEENRKFLSLSDQEKISICSGLQHDIKFHIFDRCFQCGFDVTGKVPFEYLSFKFCSMTCLKEHKNKNK